jgi:hypothetical protein
MSLAAGPLHQGPAQLFEGPVFALSLIEALFIEVENQTYAE